LDINLKFELEKINHNPYNDIEFYRLIHKVEKRITSREPLTIDFIDPISLELNNNCFLTTIQKTMEYSGKQLVNLCIEICKKLKINKIIVCDGATINCDGVKIDLSLLKLIENKKTYYMSLGFNVEKSNTDYFLEIIKDKDTILHLMNVYIDKIRLIKTKKIIKECDETICLLKKAQEENYSNDLEITINYPKIYHGNPSYVENPITKISKILDLVNEALNILNDNKDNEFIYKVLITLSKTNCKKYSILMEYLTNPYMISYDSKIITRKYVDSFVTLTGLKKKCFYSYSIYYQ
jgi:hypothetical protein